MGFTLAHRRRDADDDALFKVVREAHLRGLLEGLGGPALMGTDARLTIVKRWIQKRAAAHPSSSTSDYDELLKKALQEACREVFRSADQAVKRHGLGYKKVV